MPDPQYLSTDPNAGQYLSSDPNAGTPIESAPTAPSTGVGRFVSTAIEEANPITALQSIYQAVKDPKAALASVIASHEAVAQKAKDEYAKGNYQDAAVHALNAVIPLLGPKIDELAERGAKGDWAGLLGGATGVGLSMAGPEVAKAGVNAVARLPAVLPTAVADTADAMATRKLVDVMAPKGQSRAKLQLGNVAEKIAPKIAREPGLGAMSRQELADKIGGKLDEAGDALDAANTARPASSQIPTSQVIADLQAQRQRFTTSNGKVPDPFMDRVSQIDDAIKAVRKLGPAANYDDLKVIRQAYDDRAKASYNAATTPNYGQAMGQKQGAGDVASTIRQHLSKADPTTADANARYSLFKNAQDVMQATEEVERTKPKVGRQMIAKAAGTAIGGEMGGVPGMALGYVLGPMLDTAVSSGVTTKIATARMLASLADAIRKGQPALVNARLMQVASATGQASRVRALLAQTPVSLPVAAQDQTATQP